MLCRRVALLLALLCTSCTVRAAELKLPLLWTAETKTSIESAPTLADIYGDGGCEVLAAGHEELIALGSGGKQLWRWHAPGRLMTYPSVLERKGQPGLIYVADGTGTLSCLTGLGKVVWQSKLAGTASWSAAVICDLRHDGSHEVIQTDEAGGIFVFDALTGKRLWQSAMKGAVVNPAVGDVDGDGKDEIAFASANGQLALYDCTGKLRWERKVSGASGNYATSAPVIFGASDGRARIAVGGAEGCVRCLDANGAELWTRETSGAVASTLSVGDMDHDGRADIFAITGTGLIYRFDEDGAELWKIDMQGRSIAAGAIVDLQNDGHLDFIACTQSGRLMVFNDRGEAIFEHAFQNRTINMTPTFGHVEKDRTGLDMVITGGESGRVFCFGTPAALEAPESTRPWIAYRGNLHKTGAWFGLAQSGANVMAPSDPSCSHLAAGDPVEFRIRVAETQNLPLKAVASCLRPDGSRQSATTPVYGSTGALSLPVDVVRPGAYQLKWSVVDSKGLRLAGGERAVFIEPFANDRAIVERALAALSSTADRVESALPLAAAGLRREASLLKEDAAAVEPLQSAMAGGTGAVEQVALSRTASLVQAARRGTRIAAAVEAAQSNGSGASIIPFVTTLWESNVDSQLPQVAVSPLKIARRVAPNQHDPASIKLFNITNRDLQVRVLIDSPDGGPAVTPFRSIEVPTAQGGMSWDALTELDETSILTIPPFTTRELWLSASFAGVKPGDREVKVRLLALNGFGVLDSSKSKQDFPAPETVVDLHYHVLPFTMAPESSFRMCCWASYSPGVIPDLLDHGNNVFTAPSGVVQFDATGRLSGCDYTKLDEVLTPLRGHDAFVLVEGNPELKAGKNTPEYAADFKAWLTGLTAHMASMGFDRDHFAMYPYDEPGGNGWTAVNGLVEFGQHARVVDPKIKIYADGGAELPMFKKMAPYVDVWCPPLPMLAENSPEMAVIKGTHRAIWSYDCGYGVTTAMGANLKDTNIVAEYRLAALFALRWGGAGIGFWCYNIGQDPWQRAADDYPMVYPGRTKPVTSRRWEAVRQGIEDYRLLTALRSSEAKVKSPALKKRINDLFVVRLPGILDRGYHELQVGLGRAALMASKNDATLGAFREEMLDCIDAVGREYPAQ